MALFEIKAEIAAADVDTVEEHLLEIGSAGWSILQDAIARRAWVIGIFADETEAWDAWKSLKPALSLVAEVEGRVLPDQDWRDSYKAHFKAWQFGRLHWVPLWEKAAFQLPAGDEVLWLDPGLAFGTGNHETTRLCVERLVKIAETKVKLETLRVVDAGCGSGILALSAAKLGFKLIEGFDNDPEAVRISDENAALNQLVGRVQFTTADLVSGLRTEQADVLLANIQADVLMKFADYLLGAVRPGGTLVLSGILAIELDKVRELFSNAAPVWQVDSRVMGEWSDVILTRPA